MSNSTPLAGVKVLDFSWALVGSLTTKLLADFGAEVVKVESALRPCLSRIDKQVSVSSRESLDDKPWFSHFNSSKLSLQLNMKHPRVREVINPLLDWADVVVENFSPGTMEKLGLDYPTIKAQHPDIIMVSGSVFGQTGPYAKNWGVDGTGAALAGRMYMTGWPDRDPVTPSVPYGDVVLPYFMASAVAAAIEHKRTTGQGEYIDASMYEVCVQQMSEAIIESQVFHAPPSRQGNRSRSALYQGVFPCRDDQWIAISIFNEMQWQALVNCVAKAHAEQSAWPAAENLDELTPPMLDELDALVSEWTGSQERYALMELLQTNHIAAGVVQDIADTFENDPQLQHRDYLKTLDHPLLGEFGHQTPPVKLSRTPADVKLAPNMGQHCEYVCKQIIGMTDDVYESLRDENLFV
ncbi:CaiB/BaiF CoA transferase family protein [Aurantivibrio plasticivorans]